MSIEGKIRAARALLVEASREGDEDFDDRIVDAMNLLSDLLEGRVDDPGDLRTALERCLAVFAPHDPGGDGAEGETWAYCHAVLEGRAAEPFDGKARRRTNLRLLARALDSLTPDERYELGFFGGKAWTPPTGAEAMKLRAIHERNRREDAEARALRSVSTRVDTPPGKLRDA